MTAEIAILNRYSVALAADSAVTIGARKVYNSVNKLFALSKFHPIGIMIYGSAEIMGVPWETIIKIFREKIHDKSLPTVQSYADEFLNFLEVEQSLFPEKMQGMFVGRIAYLSFQEIRAAIEKDLSSFMIANNNQASLDDIKRITKTVLKKFISITDNFKRLRSLDDISDEQFIAKYKKTIEDAKISVFEKLELDDEDAKNADLTVARYCLHNIFAYGCTGIVIAGFGVDQYFPSLRSYRIEAVIDNKLKFYPDDPVDISYQMGASINPFAQSDMVFTVVQGIDPKQSHTINGILDSIGLQTADFVTRILKETLSKDFQEKENVVRQTIETQMNGLIQQTKDELSKERRISYVDPVIEAVAQLPHVELAAMAESLVTLTSFKRRITLDQETVGGPVDVAVITKGDGFIWVKRKHYFDADLNPAFISNYLRNRQLGVSHE